MAAIAPHLHIGFMEFVIFFFELIVALFILRMLSVWMAGNAFGQALSFIH